LLQVEKELDRLNVVAAQERAKRLHQEVPTAVGPLRLLGRSYLAGGEWNEALSSLNEVLASPVTARDLVARIAKARALEGLKQRDEAASVLVEVMSEPNALNRSEALVAAGPREWETWIRAAQVLTQHGQLEAADQAVSVLVTHYTGTRAAMEGTVEVMAAIVDALKGQGKRARARLVLRRWRQRAGPDPIILAGTAKLRAVLRGSS
jgi:hypothetical protein